MFLTASNLAHYLIARGRLSPEAVVDGRFMVVEAGRRNRNFKVFVEGEAGLFVKQVGSQQPQAAATLQREAACYRLAQSDAAHAPLAALMPRLVDYDPARHVLMLELIAEGENLTEYHLRKQVFPQAVGTALGRSLGAYHSSRDQLLGEEAASPFPRQLPWILSIYQADAASEQLSGGTAQLIQVVQQYPEFQALLSELQEEWTFDSLIHGDMKWDNCIVLEDATSGTYDFHIVDWELADVGDAAWDVGAIVQSYLTFWIQSMPTAAETAPEQFVRQAAYKLEDMQPALQAFWDAYAAARQLSDAQAAPLLRRCVRYGAARMVQTAFEYLQVAPQLSNAAVALMQVSLNILQEPDESITELLELAPTPS